MKALLRDGKVLAIWSDDSEAPDDCEIVPIHSSAVSLIDQLSDEKGRPLWRVTQSPGSAVRTLDRVPPDFPKVKYWFYLDNENNVVGANQSLEAPGAIEVHPDDHGTYMTEPVHDGSTLPKWKYSNGKLEELNDPRLDVEISFDDVMLSPVALSFSARTLQSEVRVPINIDRNGEQIGIAYVTLRSGSAKVTRDLEPGKYSLTPAEPNLHKFNADFVVADSW